MRLPSRLLPSLLGLVALVPLAHAAPVKLTKLADRVRVEIGGQLFTEYVHGDGATRPYCYPILSADGTSLTRDFPMKDTPGEETDHPWHRSITFTHAYVNGVDFWNEGTGDAARSPKAKGRSTHESFVETKDGEVGVITTRNRWIAPDGKLICTDQRTLRFHSSPAGRFIDFEITLQALPGEPLLLGDNKDGTMGYRVPQWMTLPHKYKGKDVPGEGQYLTSTGIRGDAAWGKRAAWCDIYAPHNGKVYGVAIFDHPQNLRHPTWWMARGYGLFAANPFGQHDFENLKDQPTIGNHTIPAGGSLTLRYRFYFHEGDPDAAKVADQYAAYAGGK
jgi:hypothetical protein